MYARFYVALTSNQVPDEDPGVSEAGQHAAVGGADGQRHGVAARLPLLEQRARLQVVHHDEVGAWLVQLARHHAVVRA